MLFPKKHASRLFRLKTNTKQHNEEESDRRRNKLQGLATVGTTSTKTWLPYFGVIQYRQWIRVDEIVHNVAQFHFQSILRGSEGYTSGKTSLCDCSMARWQPTFKRNCVLKILYLILLFKFLPLRIDSSKERDNQRNNAHFQ